MRTVCLQAVFISICLVLAACSTTPRKAPVSPPYQYPVQTERLPRAEPEQGPFQPNANLFTCRARLSNRPETLATGQIRSYNPIIMAFGHILATAPVNDVCLSSGFGPRNGRMHKGIDLFSPAGGTIYSAAPGRVLELSSQSGYGHQLVIDHGRGVYTRYAHLASFAPDLQIGDELGFGVAIGTMGQTGNATGIHLHYEILTGDYNTPERSYGLTAHNPLDFPAWSGLSVTD